MLARSALAEPKHPSNQQQLGLATCSASDHAECDVSGPALLVEKGHRLLNGRDLAARSFQRQRVGGKWDRF